MFAVEDDGQSHDADPGADAIRSYDMAGVGRCRVWGEVEGVSASAHRGAGEAGSPMPFRDLGTRGGSDVVASIPELRLGNTGSIKG